VRQRAEQRDTARIGQRQGSGDGGDCSECRGGLRFAGQRTFAFIPARKKPTAISRDGSHRLALRRLLAATVEGVLGCQGKRAMTTNEDDPFGRSDRTIIRPNPAGRLTPPLPRAPDVAKAPGVQPTPPFLPSPFSAPSPPFSAPPLSQQVGGWDEETRAPRPRRSGRQPLWRLTRRRDSSRSRRIP
jgi:hypothetical protein